MNTRAKRGLSRFARVVLYALCVGACGGRGCTKSKILSDYTLVADAGGVLRATVSGTDCPSGLARCEDGERFVSEAARLPAGMEADRCPWRSLGDCVSGAHEPRCVAEGVVIVVDEQDERLASERLCVPATPRAVPVQPLPAAACDEGESFVCRTGDAGPPRIVRCKTATVVSTCVHGCGSDALADDGDGLTDSAAGSLLCAAQ